MFPQEKRAFMRFTSIWHWLIYSLGLDLRYSCWCSREADSSVTVESALSSWGNPTSNTDSFKNWSLPPGSDKQLLKSFHFPDWLELFSIFCPNIWSLTLIPARVPKLPASCSWWMVWMPSAWEAEPFNPWGFQAREASSVSLCWHLVGP